MPLVSNYQDQIDDLWAAINSFGEDNMAPLVPDVAFDPSGGISPRWNLSIDENPDNSDLKEVIVGDGQWTRNGLITSWAEDFVNDTPEASSTLYIIAFLVSVLRNPGTYPDLGTAGINIEYVPSLGPVGDLIGKNSVIVLGTCETDSSSEVTEVTQWLFSDVDDVGYVPDSQSTHSGVSPLQNTLEMQEHLANTRHWHDLTLVGSFDAVQNPAEQYRIPYLEQDASNDGTLRWSTCDGDDTGVEDGTQQSLQLRDDKSDPYYLQLWGFDSPASHNLLAANDRILMRDADGPELVYVSPGDFASYIDGYLVAANISGFVDEHHYLNSGDTTGDFDDEGGASNADHDKRYWRKGEGHPHNYGTAIGRNATEKVIDLTNTRLIEGTGTNPTVDWSALTLSDANNNETLDWDNSGNIDITNNLMVAGTQVVTSQQAAVANAGTVTEFNDPAISDPPTQAQVSFISLGLDALVDETQNIQVQLTALLDALRAHGLIAT